MSVESTAAVAAGAAAQASAKRHLDPANLLSFKFYGVVEAAQERLAAKLDANQDGGVDLQELNALGGLGAGKNGSAAFAALDSNDDGKLNLRELQSSKAFSPEVLETLLGQQGGAGLSGWLVTEGDADGDGALSLEEFREVGSTSALGRAPVDSRYSVPKDWIEQTFTAADADADGKVTATELAEVGKNYIRRIWPGQNPNALAANLMGRDQDGSGGLSKAELAREDADAILETGDADKNGEVSLAELQAQIALLPDFYARGVIKITRTPLQPLDPSDPNSRAQVAAAMEAIADFQPPAAGQTGLLRLFREEMLRLTQAMVDEVAKPAGPAAA